MKFRKTALLASSLFLILISTFAISGSVAFQGITGSPKISTLSPYISQKSLERVVVARIYNQGQWTLPNETAVTVGVAIAKLNATYVSQLIRLSATAQLTPQMIINYNTVRHVVSVANPNAIFDIVLNAMEYPNSSSIVNRMQTIIAAIHVDGFYFDFYHPAYKTYPQVVEDGISYAHSQGKFVAGDIFGGSFIPPNTDFIVCCEGNFTVDQNRLIKFHLTYGPDYPILVHLNNNPSHYPYTESCVFMYNYNTTQRQSYVAELARNQTQMNYHYMYNVFFPQCPTRLSYDSLNDGTMFRTIKNLMGKYNPLSIP